MKQIVCESIRVMERGREGLSSSVFGKARRETGRGREWGSECFHLHLLEKHLILG